HRIRLEVVDHGGVHRGGVDRVDPDHVRRQLVGEGLHQTDDAVLGRDVVGEVRQALDPGGGAGQHDGPALAVRLEVRNGGTDGLVDASEVDVDHVGPHLVGDVLDRREAGDPGVRQDDVQTPELGDPLVDGRL